MTENRVWQSYEYASFGDHKTLTTNMSYEITTTMEIRLCLTISNEKT